MARGTLRVYLGLAPGVGKTYRMLDEGWRRRERGADVVVALVETHGRANTAAQLRDLEVVPRRTIPYRDTTFTELDLEAVLARAPEVVLVDELAHTNVPGLRHEKRWEDVEELLEAGIDVITTVNIQHLESVNDVVEKITGIVQRETVPDAVVRRAGQIELVDITPEALRRRMAHGNIYPAEKIDASLSNYFRTGNLTALRELSLLWLADRVDEALQGYLDTHGIEQTWETRERLIVAVTGTPAADEVLLRRAARIAARTHAELVAVHVRDAGTLEREVDSELAATLVAEFDGAWHEVVGEDVASDLVAFARAERGTQLVLGATRRRRPWQVYGTIERVLRRAHDLDVHIIAVPVTAHETRRRPRLFEIPRLVTGLAAVAVVLPLLTAALCRGHAVLSLSSVFLVYLIAVLVFAALRGLVVGCVAALVASGLENFYFVPPVHTLAIARPDDAVAVVAFFAFSVVASQLMQGLRRRSLEVLRARAEAEVLTAAIGTSATDPSQVRVLLESLCRTLDVEGVEVLDRDGKVVASVGDIGHAGVVIGNEDAVVRLSGGHLSGADRRLVSALATRLGATLAAQHHLEATRHEQAERADEKLRLGLVRSVAAGLTPALDGLDREVARLRRRVGASEIADLARAVDAVADVATTVLEAGRLTSDRLHPTMWRLDPLTCLTGAIDRARHHGVQLELDLPGSLPAVLSDPALLERSFALLLSRATHTKDARALRISAGVTGEGVEVLVLDRGSQRANDPGVTDDVALVVATGLLERLGASLRVEDTPGGGLTVVVTLPLEHAGPPVEATLE